MQPIPTDRPVVWGDDEPTLPMAAVARVSRAEFERRWGPPHLRDVEGDGLGPTAS
ncbi:hypothetical protein ACN469_22210 [Corallococcus terminator]